MWKTDDAGGRKDVSFQLERNNPYKGNRRDTPWQDHIVEQENKPCLQAMGEYLQFVGLDYEEVKARIDVISKMYQVEG